MRAYPCMLLAAALCSAAFAQSIDTPPAFQIADVHVSPRAMNLNMSGGFLRAGRYEIRKATMVDLISTAYGVDADKVIGGPSWLETDRFGIIAKAPANTPPETVKLMLQTLLADRFKLVVHKDTKSQPAFVLSLGKGKPKLKESAEGSGPPGCQGQPQTPQPGVIPYAVVSCHNMTMEAIAQNLRGMAGAYVTNTVVDQTGLKGTWDFDLKWTARQLLGQAGADGITIFDAVDKQLGLKLEPGKATMPVIIVDSVNEKPTDNPPGVTTALPAPPPAEFEVANIKPSAPGLTNQIGRIQNDRLDLQNFPLKTLILLAWDMNGDEMLAGAPKFLDTARFDVVAKAYTGEPGKAPEVDIDILRLMVRNLLADRFKLATHTEDRPVSGYVLTSVKPKLQKADPANRTGCKEGPGLDGKDPRIANPVLSRLLTCQNMTIAQFAELLPTIANGYAHTPVLDSTGLTDAYDFTLSFSAIGLLQSGGGPGQPAGDRPGASDPNGALSLPDAINKQLGLKMELQKRPMPVLVIDHIEEIPTEN
jgi:uncharacterized protein (TIGR03435 family)